MRHVHGQMQISLSKKKLALCRLGDNIGPMEILGKYSAAWTLVIFLMIGLYFLIKALLGYGRISRDAETEFTFREKDGTLDTGKKDGFIRAYRRFYAPRKDKYRGLGILAATLLTVPGIRLFEYVSEKIWIWAGKPYEFGPSTLLWQFMLFFALIAFWGLIFLLVAQIYHKRAPVTFRDELIKEGV